MESFRIVSTDRFLGHCVDSCAEYGNSGYSCGYGLTEGVRVMFKVGIENGYNNVQAYHLHGNIMGCRLGTVAANHRDLRSDEEWEHTIAKVLFKYDKNTATNKRCSGAARLQFVAGRLLIVEDNGDADKKLEKMVSANTNCGCMDQTVKESIGQLSPAAGEHADIDDDIRVEDGDTYRRKSCAKRSRRGEARRSDNCKRLKEE